MLSYQHEYHAGNFADLHKHLTMRLIFETLLKKNKPFCYIDCHSGSGKYDLRSTEALKTNEHLSGINLLWDSRGKTDTHPTLQALLAAVANTNVDNNLHHYPGSPCLAQQWLRAQDKALLMELHPQALGELRRNLSGDSRFNIHARDCYEGLPALVPPPIKRGVVLLDPSYEVKEEYSQVVSLVCKAHQRWKTCSYAIWYPILPAGRHHQLLDELSNSGLSNILTTELTINNSHTDHDEPSGMTGSGVAIVNAPWQIDQALMDLMPTVASTLAPDTGKASVTWLIE